MEDLSGLASSLAAGVVDVRACLIASRDGLVVGAHPGDAETNARSAWLRFAALGEAERGFAQFATETWCYVRRGPYSAFALVGPRARPGLVLDHLDQILLSAEEGRRRRDEPRALEGPSAPSVAPSRPRTPLHPDPRPTEGLILVADGVATPPGAAHATAAGAPPPSPPATPADTPAAAGEPDAEPTEDAVPALPDEADAVVPEEADEVDRFSLAREFGQLLQDDEDGADG